ncbi:hypothetical protein IWQ62_002150 [Dispira parvispora]|uniref:ABC transporter domain-containing protein n=1 Tax=Dispira parvispora TaxID=1520584 RepID=A0A9W8ARZ1_9FUNG|nr:hypothetical protein IWQ62_002150 [Dispira parvispora]
MVSDSPLLVVQGLSKHRITSRSLPPSRAAERSSSSSSLSIPSLRTQQVTSIDKGKPAPSSNGLHPATGDPPGLQLTTSDDNEADAEEEAQEGTATQVDRVTKSTGSLTPAHHSVITLSDEENTPADYLWYDVHFTLNPRDTIVIQGPSGVGKTTLLRAIAQLTDCDSGTVLLRQQSPKEMGIPIWRSRVMYVPQYPAIFPGSPLDFFFKVKQFSAHTSKDYWDDPVDIANRWGLDEDLWCSEWRTLSGGQAQRAALAIAIATRPDVLLLDEPTSALDPQSTRLVEDTLRDYTCLWITHDPQQAERVATKYLDLRLDGSCEFREAKSPSNHGPTMRTG